MPGLSSRRKKKIAPGKATPIPGKNKTQTAFTPTPTRPPISNSAMIRVSSRLGANKARTTPKNGDDKVSSGHPSRPQTATLRKSSRVVSANGNNVLGRATKRQTGGLRSRVTPSVGTRASKVPPSNQGEEEGTTPIKSKAIFAKPNVSLLDKLNASMDSSSELDDDNDENSTPLKNGTKIKQRSTSKTNNAPGTPPAIKKKVRKNLLEIVSASPRKSEKVSKSKSLENANAPTTGDPPSHSKIRGKRTAPNPPKSTESTAKRTKVQDADPEPTASPSRKNRTGKPNQPKQKKKPAIMFPSKKGKKIQPNSNSEPKSPPASPLPHNRSISIRPQLTAAASTSTTRQHQSGSSSSGLSRSQNHRLNTSALFLSRQNRRPSVFESMRSGAGTSGVASTSKNNNTAVKNRTERGESPEKERYVGNDVFGNYSMMKDKDVINLVNELKPDHGLDQEHLEMLCLRINHWLEDFFVLHCNESRHPYGFIPFDQLKQALIDQCLLEEDASCTDFLGEMREGIPKKDFIRSEGVLYPTRYSLKEDNDDFPYSEVI